jgi:hypothetical protein
MGATGRKTSLLRVGMFAIALFANLDYLLFVIPLHGDNLVALYVVQLAAGEALIRT